MAQALSKSAPLKSMAPSAVRRIVWLRFMFKEIPAECELTDCPKNACGAATLTVLNVRRNCQFDARQRGQVPALDRGRRRGNKPAKSLKLSAIVSARSVLPKQSSAFRREPAP